MAELAAQGSEPLQRWRSALEAGRTYILGRNGSADLPIPWDGQISGQHARLTVEPNGQLTVTKLALATNPIFHRGDSAETISLEINGRFVIGTTIFTWLKSDENSTPSHERLAEEIAFTHQQLAHIRYQDPENRLEVLTHLPEVIAGARDDQELHHRLVNLLLKGVVHAEAAAIVSITPDDAIRVWHWERRRETAGELLPSRRLAWEAIAHRKNSVLHVWEGTSGGAHHEQTLATEFDWAYCTPVAGLTNEPAGLYIAGTMGPTFVPGTTLSSTLQLDADVKFTELVAEIIGAVVRARRMERQKAGLRQFFAPPILAALGDELDTTLLEPCECDVTVMFCDLRGFSQRAEHAAGDLIGLLERVSRALGVMTHHILDHGGVTGDFQGDATLGFWGWPFSSPDAAVHACRAALGIREAFEKAAAQKNHPLADFAMGIGVAHGRAVAGKIGTADQVKVTVFGPVVNLASRLENMTKTLRVPIVIDEATRKIVRERMPAGEGRVRMLARVLPYGLDQPVLVSELLPPTGPHSELTDEHVQQYEAGVAAFLAGRWDDAYRHLHQMPAGDRAQDFLLQQITANNRVPPTDWDGMIRFPGK